MDPPILVLLLLLLLLLLRAVEQEQEQDSALLAEAVILGLLLDESVWPVHLDQPCQDADNAQQDLFSLYDTVSIARSLGNEGIKTRRGLHG